MIEAYLRAITEEFSDIVKSVDRVEISEEEQISKLKSKLILFDGTIFWVREVWLKERIEVYSYYWLRSDGTIVMGWDNAPHHKAVDSYPHHRHVRNKIEPSKERNLKDALNFIRNFIG